ncbi:MAG: glycosyltransferase, partial [Lachnospiraceae bacterium]|nr:glycosyltransferase [Lachnospiraceae bacterium]
MKNYGVRECVRRIRFHINGDGYRLWWKTHRLTEDEAERQRQRVFERTPLISIPVPLYNTPLQYLRELIDSVQSQTYGSWELCLADGSTDDQAEQFIRQRYAGNARIKYRRLSRNSGIAGNTNEAVSMAEGEYIGLLDHDDLLAPNALFEVVKVINEHTGADVIYTDEDKISDDITDHFGPAFKPDFNLDLLRSCNYICHFFVVKKDIADEIHGFRSEFDGSQDYDFILRCVERAECVYHIPMILYHWRCHPNSVAGNPENKLYAYEAGRRAIEEHLRRTGEPDAQVERLPFWGHYRVNYPVRNRDRVSILIVNTGSAADLRRCVDSILSKTTYPDYHIYIAGSGCTDR